MFISVHWLTRTQLTDTNFWSQFSFAVSLVFCSRIFLTVATFIFRCSQGYHEQFSSMMRFFITLNQNVLDVQRSLCNETVNTHGLCKHEWRETYLSSRWFRFCRRKEKIRFSLSFSRTSSHIFFCRLRIVLLRSVTEVANSRYFSHVARSRDKMFCETVWGLGPTRVLHHLAQSRNCSWLWTLVCCFLVFFSSSTGFVRKKDALL